MALEVNLLLSLNESVQTLPELPEQYFLLTEISKSRPKISLDKTCVHGHDREKPVPSKVYMLELAEYPVQVTVEKKR